MREGLVEGFGIIIGSLKSLIEDKEVFFGVVDTMTVFSISFTRKKYESRLLAD